MPNLQKILEGNDLGFFRIVANFWGIEMTAPDGYTALNSLLNEMRSPRLTNEIIEALPAEARTALQALWENEGHLLWAQFCRLFGEVRDMGPARRDRERPDLHPVSPAEVLWYRGLIGRHFLHFPPSEPEEYACVPEEFLDILMPFGSPGTRPLGRQASPVECAHPTLADTRILDHACTLLAALRLKLKPGENDTTRWNIPRTVLQDLLRCAGLINARNQPEPEATRTFMEASRSQALAQLAAAWLKSTSFSDLHHLSGLKFEGNWQDNPLQARQAVLDLLSRLPQNTWWNLYHFIQAIKEQRPDFQRTAGDYDSWYILEENGTYLRGFTSWDKVDGALVRFFICGPLHWLGIVDLAAPGSASPISAFRLSLWAPALWHGKAPEMKAVEEDPIRVALDGTLTLTPRSSRAARYQVARFCEWLTESDEKYIYRLTPASLERAAGQGLKVSHVLSLLKRYAANPLPPALIQALERLEKYGSQSSLAQVSILRVTTPEILTVLQQTHAVKFLGETLNPTTVIIKPGGQETVRKALLEKGYLLDADLADIPLKKGGV